MGIFGLAQGFAGLAVNFLPAEPNATLAIVLFVGAFVCIAAGVFLFVRPQQTEEAAATVTQSGSRNVQFQGQTINFQGTISTGEGEVLATRLSGGRTLVDVTPDYLRGLFKDHTSIQAEKLLEAFIGKWIRVSGTVEDVVNMSEGRANVYFQGDTGSGRVSMGFNDRSVVEVLRRGDAVTVIGQVKSADSLFVKLNNCELEQS